MYIELHAASAFSFLRGASLPEALVERAATLGYPALAVLDADGVYGAPRFHKAAKQAGLKAIIGAALTIEYQQPSLNTTPRGTHLRQGSGGQAEAPGISRGLSHPNRRARFVESLPRSLGLPAGALAKVGASVSRDQWMLPVLVASTEGYRNLCRLVTRMKMRAP